MIFGLSVIIVMDDLWVRSTRGYHKLEHNKHRSGERWSQVGAILLFTITIRLETLRLDGLRLQFSLRLEWRATRAVVSFNLLSMRCETFLPPKHPKLPLMLDTASTGFTSVIDVE